MKYFSAPESQSLRVALTRYIVNNFYPDNDMLASTLLPRWSALAWIISQCTVSLILSPQFVPLRSSNYAERQETYLIFIFEFI